MPASGDTTSGSKAARAKPKEGEGFEPQKALEQVEVRKKGKTALARKMASLGSLAHGIADPRIAKVPRTSPQAGVEKVTKKKLKTDALPHMLAAVPQATRKEVQEQGQALIALKNEVSLLKGKFASFVSTLETLAADMGTVKDHVTGAHLLGEHEGGQTKYKVTEQGSSSMGDEAAAAVAAAAEAAAAEAEAARAVAAAAAAAAAAPSAEETAPSHVTAPPPPGTAARVLARMNAAAATAAPKSAPKVTFQQGQPLADPRFMPIAHLAELGEAARRAEEEAQHREQEAHQSLDTTPADDAVLEDMTDRDVLDKRNLLDAAVAKLDQARARGAKMADLSMLEDLVAKYRRELRETIMGGKKVSSVKLTPPAKFKGNKEEVLEDSLFAFENFLSGSGVPKAEWAVHGMQFLQGKALATYIAFAQPLQLKGIIPTWEQFTSALKDAYANPARQEEARLELLTIKQSGNVTEYARKFSMVLNRAGVTTISEDMAKTIYWNGLAEWVRQAAPVDPHTGQFWSSYEALRVYTLGLEQHQPKQPKSTKPAYRRAYTAAFRYARTKPTHRGGGNGHNNNNRPVGGVEKYGSDGGRGRGRGYSDRGGRPPQRGRFGGHDGGRGGHGHADGAAPGSSSHCHDCKWTNGAHSYKCNTYCAECTQAWNNPAPGCPGALMPNGQRRRHPGK